VGRAPALPEDTPVTDPRQPTSAIPRNRRRASDRRRRATPLLSRHTLRGRRTRIRRDADLARGRYVDRSSGVHLLMIVLLVLLISVDTFSTLYILEQEGGSELNPLMVRTLERGVGWFVLVKLGPLPLAYALLSVHRYFSWVRVALGVLVAVYGVLTVYHASLLWRILL
jgi:hypothetical protein